MWKQTAAVEITVQCTVEISHFSSVWKANSDVYLQSENAYFIVLTYTPSAGKEPCARSCRCTQQHTKFHQNVPNIGQPATYAFRSSVTLNNESQGHRNRYRNVKLIGSYIVIQCLRDVVSTGSAKNSIFHTSRNPKLSMGENKTKTTLRKPTHRQWSIANKSRPIS